MRICDNLPCMNLIPDDEYERALEKVEEARKKQPGIYLITCGHCEDSPPPSARLKEIIDMTTEESIDELRQACRSQEES